MLLLRIDCMCDGSVERTMCVTFDYCLDDFKYVYGADSN